MAGLGWARPGEAGNAAWPGQARHGQAGNAAWPGQARQGRAGNEARRGRAGQGVAGRGRGQGVARLGGAWQGLAGRGTGLGAAWRGLAGQGWERGAAWHGLARRGGARNKARPGMAWLGRAGHGGEQGFASIVARKKKDKAMEKKSGVFGGGVPTDIDLRRLREAFPPDSLKVGTLIPYANVAAAILCEVNSYRYRTVTNRWRKIIEAEHGKIIGTKAKEGFIVLDDHEKLDLSSAKLRSSRRAARRSLQVAAKIDRKELTESECIAHDLNTLRAAAITATSQIRKALDLPSLG